MLPKILPYSLSKEYSYNFDEFQPLIKEKAFTYLIEQVKERNMTKIINNKYSGLKIQEYLNCSEASKNIKKFTFKLRTKMIEVGENFGNKGVCPICNIGQNSQKHL